MAIFSIMNRYLARLLGGWLLIQEKRTCHHAGRDFRLTDVDGEVVKAILARLISSATLGRRLRRT